MCNLSPREFSIVPRYTVSPTRTPLCVRAIYSFLPAEIALVPAWSACLSIRLTCTDAGGSRAAFLSRFSLPPGRYAHGPAVSLCGYTDRATVHCYTVYRHTHTHTHTHATKPKNPLNGQRTCQHHQHMPKAVTVPCAKAEVKTLPPAPPYCCCNIRRADCTTLSSSSAWKDRSSG